MIPCRRCKYFWPETGECRVNPPTPQGFPKAPKGGGCAKGFPTGLEKFDCGDCRWFRDGCCYKRDIGMGSGAGACPHFEHD
ncbi:MAG: hypothetical protein EOM25_15130 [Deltaproteobacteria bacterium]|nr:hypothetical protein [Deltaproteobacteria bacterium]